jgi:hypothetical protein
MDADVMRGYIETRREILASEGFDVGDMLARIEEAGFAQRTLQAFVRRFVAS